MWYVLTSDGESGISAGVTLNAIDSSAVDRGQVERESCLKLQSTAGGSSGHSVEVREGGEGGPVDDWLREATEETGEVDQFIFNSYDIIRRPSDDWRSWK